MARLSAAPGLDLELELAVPIKKALKRQPTVNARDIAS
jgi:2-keto-4-pentenoate hydratase/2-oxohepta-3-ene-1,7-dioic acid hydratase in catechol pathway